MPTMFYNTLTRQKEEFRPIRKGHVGIYSCGPTVYNYAHIGNFRAYVFADILRRFLEYSGYKLKHVMNITDVDDKTIRDSRKEGTSLKEFTQRYEKAFFEDIATLNIEKVEAYPRATEHIGEMVKLIKTLMDKGFAYKGGDAIYFSISKFRDYGKLAHLENAELKSVARVSQDEYDKEQAQDFALWKFWDEKDGDVFWETGIGKGRPGWHIECSAMSMKYLGPSLDMHTGGVDLIFPHHQNEIAQSEAATGKKFVRHWLHNEHLLVDGQKMSKSLGNFFTLRDLVKKGHDPMAIRYLLLATHYRQKLNLSEESLKSSAQALGRLREFAANAREGSDGKGMDVLCRESAEGFRASLDDDLNMPEALSAVFDFVREANKLGPGKKALEQLMDFDAVLGLRLADSGRWHSLEEADDEVRKLIFAREEARKRKDWKESDRIRSALRREGITVEDTGKGPRWKREGA